MFTMKMNSEFHLIIGLLSTMLVHPVRKFIIKSELDFTAKERLELLLKELK
jgi:hypothetical protein